MNDYQMSVLAPVCPDCGADVAGLLRDIELDWRDDRERELGRNADAVQQHRARAHTVAPKVGDVVAYFKPWRGLIIGNGPLRVASVWADDIGTHCMVVNPARTSDYYLPTVGYDDWPITFELVDEYVTEPVQTSLFDLLGGEWAEVAA